MRKKRFAALTGLLALLAVGIMAVAQSGAGAEVTKAPQVEIQLLFELPKSPDGAPTSLSDLLRTISKVGSGGYQGVRFDSFFDITYASNIGSSGQDGVSRRLVVSNIGSSGQDGVRAAGPDSFFDIFYEIDFKRTSSATIETEMVAMQLRATVTSPANPAGALDAVRGAISAAGGDVYIGHVTVLK